MAFTGEIQLFAGNFEPEGWAFCDGRILKIRDNQALYSTIENLYGGDNKTTFALPDMRGRAPICFGQGAGLSHRAIASKGGEEEVGLRPDQVPAHKHAAKIYAVKGNAAGDADPTNKMIGSDPVLASAFYAVPDDGAKVELNAAAIDVSGVEGGGKAHYNMQPYISMNYIICLDGDYPTRKN